MPASWLIPNLSCMSTTPSTVPTTGLTSPISAVEPAGIRRSPRNHTTYAMTVPKLPR